MYSAVKLRRKCNLLSVIELALYATESHVMVREVEWARACFYMHKLTKKRYEQSGLDWGRRISDLFFFCCISKTF